MAREWRRMKRQPSGSAASYVKPEYAHSLPAHGGDAHRRVCVTESALIRSRLRSSSNNFFAKLDYRKTIGPDRATLRIHIALRICKKGSFLQSFTVWWGIKRSKKKPNSLNVLGQAYFL
jgi:hypothetical protein